MGKINKEESGWMVALSWLSALEEAARDFHGTRPKVFCQRAYDHSVQHYLKMLGDEYGLQVEKADTIRSAVEHYIQIGVIGGLFQDESEFELVSVNPHRLDITIHHCEYLKSCQCLIDEGFAIRDLTCARIGCFRAAVKVLANLDCDYEVRSFNINGDCQGTIERI
ncbi:MAG TPA: hypothetical protein ENN17_11920 [bacterium]|nr:hypothetical protein [bacterium]